VLNTVNRFIETDTISRTPACRQRRPIIPHAGMGLVSQ
jgi:hypothetical protein